jgi:hypothetical protein
MFNVYFVSALRCACITSLIASDNCSGVLLGKTISSLLLVRLWSEKMGSNSNVHRGHMAGAESPRLHRIPATTVPCLYATLLAFFQVLRPAKYRYLAH